MHLVSSKKKKKKKSQDDRKIKKKKLKQSDEILSDSSDDFLSQEDSDFNYKENDTNLNKDIKDAYFIDKKGDKDMLLFDSSYRLEIPIYNLKKVGSESSMSSIQLAKVAHFRPTGLITPKPLHTVDYKEKKQTLFNTMLFPKESRAIKTSRYFSKMNKKELVSVHLPRLRYPLYLAGKRSASTRLSDPPASAQAFLPFSISSYQDIDAYATSSLLTAEATAGLVSAMVCSDQQLAEVVHANTNKQLHAAISQQPTTISPYLALCTAARPSLHSMFIGSITSHSDSYTAHKVNTENTTRSLLRGVEQFAGQLRTNRPTTASSPTQALQHLVTLAALVSHYAPQPLPLPPSSFACHPELTDLVLSAQAVALASSESINSLRRLHTDRCRLICEAGDPSTTPRPQSAAVVGGRASERSLLLLLGSLCRLERAAGHSERVLAIALLALVLNCGHDAEVALDERRFDSLLQEALTGLCDRRDDRQGVLAAWENLSAAETQQPPFQPPPTPQQPQFQPPSAPQQPLFQPPPAQQQSTMYSAMHGYRISLKGDSEASLYRRILLQMRDGEEDDDPATLLLPDTLPSATSQSAIAAQQSRAAEAWRELWFQDELLSMLQFRPLSFLRQEDAAAADEQPERVVFYDDLLPLLPYLRLPLPLRPETLCRLLLHAASAAGLACPLASWSHAPELRAAMWTADDPSLPHANQPLMHAEEQALCSRLIAHDAVLIFPPTAIKSHRFSALLHHGSSMVNFLIRFVENLKRLALSTVCGGSGEVVSLAYLAEDLHCGLIDLLSQRRAAAEPDPAGLQQQRGEWRSLVSSAEAVSGVTSYCVWDSYLRAELSAGETAEARKVCDKLLQSLCGLRRGGDVAMGQQRLFLTAVRIALQTAAPLRDRLRRVRRLGAMMTGVPYDGCLRPKDRGGDTDLAPQQIDASLLELVAGFGMSLVQEVAAGRCSLPPSTSPGHRLDASPDLFFAATATAYVRYALSSDFRWADRLFVAALSLLTAALHGQEDPLAAFRREATTVPPRIVERSLLGVSTRRRGLVDLELTGGWICSSAAETAAIVAMERLHRERIKFLLWVREEQQGCRMVAADVDQSLEQAVATGLSDFPLSSALLDCALSLSAARPGGYLRQQHRLKMSQERPGWGGGLQPLEAMFAVSLEIRRERLLITARADGDMRSDWTADCAERLRGRIEALLRDSRLRRVAAIWIAYIHLESTWRKKQSAWSLEAADMRKLFYRALSDNPWNKRVSMLALGPLADIWQERERRDLVGGAEQRGLLLRHQDPAAPEEWAESEAAAALC